MKTVLGITTFLAAASAIFAVVKIITDSKKSKSKARR